MDINKLLQDILLTGANIVTKDDIAKRAYEIWKENNCTPGRDNENWLQAEYELYSKDNQK